MQVSHISGFSIHSHVVFQQYQRFNMITRQDSSRRVKTNSQQTSSSLPYWKGEVQEPLLYNNHMLSICSNLEMYLSKTRDVFVQTPDNG